MVYLWKKITLWNGWIYEYLILLRFIDLRQCSDVSRGYEKPFRNIHDYSSPSSFKYKIWGEVIQIIQYYGTFPCSFRLISILLPSYIAFIMNDDKTMNLAKDQTKWKFIFISFIIRLTYTSTRVMTTHLWLIVSLLLSPWPHETNSLMKINVCWKSNLWVTSWILG